MPSKNISESVGVGARIAFLANIGSCNRCGMCCKNLVEWQMTQADPANPKGQLHRGKCYYLSGNPGNSGATTCDIMSGAVDIDTIPIHHKNYYLNECVDYPNHDDPTEWPKTGDNIQPIGVVGTACAYRKVKYVPQQ